MADTIRDARVPVYLTGAEHDELTHRAGAHGLSLSAYLREAALRGTVHASTPDGWWDALPAARKEQVWGWVGQGGKHSARPPVEFLTPLPVVWDQEGP